MAQLQRDFTEGSVGSHLIRFSLPFLLSNLIQAFYSVADMLIVGRFCGAEALSGVNIGGQVTHLVVMMVSGLTVGGTVLVGQYFGARREKDVSETIGTMFTLLTLLAVALTVIMTALATPLLKLLQTPEESFSEALVYLQICLAGNIFVFGYNAISAVQRGLGDSKRPLIFVSIACVLNIGLDLWFVGGLGMGAAGAALATITSQGVSLLLAAVYLARNRFAFDFKLKSFAPRADKVRGLIQIGLPSSVQSIITNLSFLLMTALVNGFGVYASAAVGVAGKFNSFAILPAVAMSSSISAIAAQNIGAGEYERAEKATRSGMLIALALGATVFALAQFLPEGILRLFTDDEQVVQMGATYLRAFSYDYLCVPILFCLNGLITGAGHTTVSMINNIISALALRMPVAWVLCRTALGLAGVGYAAPAATLVSNLIAVWFVLSGRWRVDRTGIRRADATPSAAE